MPPPLISLPPELLCDILRKLLIEEDRNLLLSYCEIYDNSKYAFDQKYFRVIPLTLEHESISQAKNLTKEQPYCFLEEIIIRIDQECDRYLGKLHLENRLLSLFINIFQVSTKFDIITIQYDPEKFDSLVGRYHTYTKTVVWAIKTFLKGYKNINFKIDIQNIRLHDCATLFALGKSFLNRVHSIRLRFEPYDTTVRSIQKLLPLATNLKEISLINDTSETLISNPIRKVMKVISSKTLESISIAGVDTTKDKL
jgi:hypothetical protein